jgi:hypothetical protein
LEEASVVFRTRDSLVNSAVRWPTALGGPGLIFDEQPV